MCSQENFKHAALCFLVNTFKAKCGKPQYILKNAMCSGHINTKDIKKEKFIFSGLEIRRLKLVSYAKPHLNFMYLICLLSYYVCRIFIFVCTPASSTICLAFFLKSKQYTELSFSFFLFINFWIFQ